MTRFRPWMLSAVVLVLAAGAWAAEPDAAQPGPDKPDAPAPGDAEAGGLAAVAKKVEGTVETRPAVGEPWGPVKVGMKLAEGADLRTGFRALCLLDMVDSLVQVDPLTVVRIGELARRDGTIRTRLILKHGNTAAIIEKERIESDFRIVTPSATLSVRGTKDAWVGFFPDTGGSYGLGGTGLVGVRNHLLGKQTLCRPGQKTNDRIQKPGQLLQGNFLPVNLAGAGLGPKERFAAGRWNTSNPLPGGLQGPAGPPNLLGKDQGQQKDPLLPILPCGSDDTSRDENGQYENGME